MEKKTIKLDLTKDTQKEISKYFLENEFFEIQVEERTEKSIKILEVKQ